MAKLLLCIGNINEATCDIVIAVLLAIEMKGGSEFVHWLLVLPTNITSYLPSLPDFVWEAEHLLHLQTS